MTHSKKLKASSDGEQRSRKEFLEKCLAVLTEEKPASTMQVKKGSVEEKYMREYGLLTAKEVLYIGNVDEVQIQGAMALEDYAKAHNAEAVLVSAKIEAELFEMKKEEKAELLGSLGMKEAALASEWCPYGLLSFENHTN